jgi:hypothetical protein
MADWGGCSDRGRRAFRTTRGIFGKAGGGPCPGAHRSDRASPIRWIDPDRSHPRVARINSRGFLSGRFANGRLPGLFEYVGKSNGRAAGRDPAHSSDIGWYLRYKTCPRGSPYRESGNELAESPRTSILAGSDPKVRDEPIIQPVDIPIPSRQFDRTTSDRSLRRADSILLCAPARS